MNQDLILPVLVLIAVNISLYILKALWDKYQADKRKRQLELSLMQSEQRLQDIVNQMEHNRQVLNKSLENAAKMADARVSASKKS